MGGGIHGSGEGVFGQIVKQGCHCHQRETGMADNAFIKIGTALLKHQVKKLVGEEALGAIGEELADIGGDKLDSWIGEQATPEQLEKAALYAQECFRGKVNDNDLEQWMVSLPLGNLPKVVEALEELPKSPDETKLENAL